MLKLTQAPVVYALFKLTPINFYAICPLTLTVDVSS